MKLATLDDTALAAKLALEAGRLLTVVREGSGLGGKALGDKGDSDANRFLCEAIRAARPDDGLLSEEEKDNPARLAKSRVWIIDPVDGTREYSEGRSDWAVHIALAVDGAPVVGAVALPGLAGEVVLRSDRPKPLPAMAARRWPWCAGRPRSISTPAASMNGTAARPSRSPQPTGCIARASTDRRWSITGLTPSCPIC
jgi:3'(2'), 5'-bisphosphate nucleotidase